MFFSSISLKSPSCQSSTFIPNKNRDESTFTSFNSDLVLANPASLRVGQTAYESLPMTRTWKIIRFHQLVFGILWIYLFLSHFWRQGMLSELWLLFSCYFLSTIYTSQVLRNHQLSPLVIVNMSVLLTGLDVLQAVHYGGLFALLQSSRLGRKIELWVWQSNCESDNDTYHNLILLLNLMYSVSFALTAMISIFQTISIYFRNRRASSMHIILTSPDSHSDCEVAYINEKLVGMDSQC